MLVSGALPSSSSSLLSSEPGCYHAVNPCEHEEEEERRELCLSELLPPECMEFGTQTLDSSLVDIASFDFGVQTLLTSVTKDQGSQTLC